MFILLVTVLIIALLLIVSVNVELNPGPKKKCTKCELMMPTTCKCSLIIIVIVVIWYAVLLQGFCTLVHSLVKVFKQSTPAGSNNTSCFFIDCFYLHEKNFFVPNMQFNMAKVLHFSASSFLHVQYNVCVVCFM